MDTNKGLVPINNFYPCMFVCLHIHFTNYTNNNNKQYNNLKLQRRKQYTIISGWELECDDKNRSSGSAFHQCDSMVCHVWCDMYGVSKKCSGDDKRTA